MIEITREISLDENEIEEKFIRASGPGGQNVNKVSTAVQLRFKVLESQSLPEDVRRRLIALAGPRINKDGELLIDARRFRTRERNRTDAFERLAELIRAATQKPKKRRKTRMPEAVKKARLQNKRRKGRLKKLRAGPERTEY